MLVKETSDDAVDDKKGNRSRLSYRSEGPSAGHQWATCTKCWSLHRLLVLVLPPTEEKEPKKEKQEKEGKTHLVKAEKEEEKVRETEEEEEEP